MTRSEIVDDVLAAYYSGYPRTHSERLYTCKASIVHVVDSDWIVLRSYATPVAAFQRSTSILWVFDFYSHTTAQHIAKFRNLLRYKYPYKSWDFPRRVNLYNDSRTGKRAARENIADDFSAVIESALNQH